ncbi:MAG: pantetheine-phosphate adenylyltransferase [Oligoflexales bacterium]
MKAAYLGSFDPMTLGHLDVIKRAARMCDELVVGVGWNPSKKEFIPVEKRIETLKQVCCDLPQVRVLKFSGLAVDFAKEAGVQTIVRGLRTEADYVYEMQMALMNRTLADDVDTIFIPTAQEYCHISSSLVKQIAMLKGDVSRLVPPCVAEFLIEQSSDG